MPTDPPPIVPERTQIRRKVVELLKGNTHAADRVFASRTDTVEHPEEGEPLGDFYPRIHVYTNDDPTEGEELYSESPLTVVRLLELEVEIVARAAEDVDADDQVDDLERTVVILLLNTQSIGAKGVRFLDLDFVAEVLPLGSAVSMDESGDAPEVSRVVSFRVRYATNYGDHPDDDLRRIETSFDTHREDGLETPEIEGELDLPVLDTP